MMVVEVEDWLPEEDLKDLREFLTMAVKVDVVDEGRGVIAFVIGFAGDLNKVV
jgi:hypothetical protein